MSKFLLDERPLIILPQLAKSIGLNEAVCLQQVHYWLRENELHKKHRTHFREGRWWTYNTYEQWQQEDFPFWSVATIKRTFASLEKRGLVLSAHLSEVKTDRTKWYTIDYEAVERLEVSQSIRSKCANGTAQEGTMDGRDVRRSINEAETTRNRNQRGRALRGKQRGNPACPRCKGKGYFIPDESPDDFKECECLVAR